MSRILECKLNELTEQQKQWQQERTAHIDELAYIEKQLQIIQQKKEELKREYALDNLRSS